MQTNEYKKYWPLISISICGILTVISLAYFMFLFVSWQKTSTKASSEVLEVRLPVMNWSQYSILSKKYEDVTFNNDINK